MARKKLGEILIEAGILDVKGLRAALGEQMRWGGPLGRHLVDMRLIEEPVLIQALSKQLGLPSVDLDQWEVDQPVLERLDAETAMTLSAVPFRIEGKFIDVAMGDPMNLSGIDELQIRTKLNVRPYIAGPKAIERALARFYNKGAGLLDMSVRFEDQPSGPMELSSGTMAEQMSDGLAQRPPPGELRRDARPPPGAGGGARGPTLETSEVRALQARISRLEQLVERDEAVLRKLLSLLIDKGVATRDEIADRIKS